MKNVLLEIANLEVSVDSKIVLRNFAIKVNKGEVVALMGNNGSGKSSLAMILMGNPNYKIPENQNTKESKVEFEGKNLLKMTTDERARAGIFVAWQNPVTIPGVTVFNLCKSSYEAHGYKIPKLVELKQKLEELAVKVGLTKDYVSRNVNEGFSGGERKRLELLQLLLLKPKLAILDEIDSGLDSDGVKILIKIVTQMKQAGTAFVIITHSKKLAKEIGVEAIWKTTN